MLDTFISWRTFMRMTGCRSLPRQSYCSKGVPRARHCIIDGWPLLNKLKQKYQVFNTFFYSRGPKTYVYGNLLKLQIKFEIEFNILTIIMKIV